MPDQFHFNKTNINKVHAQKNRIEYQNILIPRLRLRVPETGSKSFRIYKRLRGSKPVRVTIGKYPSVTPEQAKIQARKILASLVEGINPNEQRRISTLRKISLQEAYDDYLANRNLKDRAVTGYKTVMRNQLASLASKALDEIDRESIYTIHKTAKAKGQSDLAMRLLRAVFNFARNEYLDENKLYLFLNNPVEVLSHRRQWNNSPRKNTYLRKNEIPLFLSALEEVKQDETYAGISICNALLFALLTGLRRSEILSLKWKDINFQAEYLQFKTLKTPYL
jgi:integrase